MSAEERVSAASSLLRPWLVQALLGLGFPPAIATAMTGGPARRPKTPVRRQHPESWRNIRANALFAMMRST